MKGEKTLKTGKGKRQEMNWFLVGGIVVLAFLVIVAIAIFAVMSGKSGESESDIENLEPYMTINLFPGFSGEEARTVIEGSLSNSDVLLEYAGSFDGTFYEDGEDQEKKQVFSLILTNIADDTLEVMQLWLEDENGESYQFQVSALPTGGTVLAQELDGKKFRKNAQYRIVRDNFGFLAEDPALSVLETQEADGKIYLTNTSEEPLEGVQIIYKNWLGGHAYPGGIAYRISLDKIEAGETLEITSGHYRAGESRITGMKQVVQPEGGANGESTD